MNTSVSAPNFAKLFKTLPGLYLVLDPEFRIVAVTDQYLRATMTKREAIVGKGIFEVFPENPDDLGADGTNIVKSSLQRVLRHKKEDTIPVQKYDIPRPESEGGGYEARYWSPVNSPVLAADGSVEFIIHRVEDVTEYIHLRESATGTDKGTVPGEHRFLKMEADIYARAREVAHAKATLEEEVAERTRELEDANDILKKSRRAALNLVEDAIQARKRTETALVRTQALLAQMQLLDQLTRSIGERLDLESIFQVVVRSLEDGMPVDFACVCLYEPVAQVLTVAYRGTKNDALKDKLIAANEGIVPVDNNGLSRCVNGELVYEPNLQELHLPFPELLVDCGLHSLVLAPLRSESRVFGVLITARAHVDGFSSAECEFLRQLSEHVALAMQQVQLYGALQQAYDDLRQTQQVAMQQERLRALGQMASGIAHDINNALSPVSLYTESLLETEPNLSTKARDYLVVIQRAVEDVAETVARMREFYRQREVQVDLAPVDVNSLAGQVLDLTRARWSDMQQQHGVVIKAETDLGTDLPKIMGVESEIREALTNLIFNAVDAMSDGGTLTLRTVLNATANPPLVLLEVSDTGIGMDENTRQRCLEPFFTTKGERGTGLGLATVFGMVERHSSNIEIDSSPGAGTTIRIAFPVPEETAAVIHRTEEILKHSGPLRLLLIDDDPILLKSLRDALESDGHIIATADGGKAGIERFSKAQGNSEQFAAVITDLGMPHVDGRRVATAVKETSPSTPVVLLTGWGQRMISEGDIPPCVDRVLAKPPKLRELRLALMQLCEPEPI